MLGRFLIVGAVRYLAGLAIAFASPGSRVRCYRRVHRHRDPRNLGAHLSSVGS